MTGEERPVDLGVTMAVRPLGIAFTEFVLATSIDDKGSVPCLALPIAT